MYNILSNLCFNAFAIKIALTVEARVEGSFKSSRPKADKEEVIVGESIGREENQERLEKEEQEMLEHEDINRNSGDSQILEKVEADGQIERVAGSQSTNYDDALTMTNAANIESQARSKEGEREGRYVIAKLTGSFFFRIRSHFALARNF
jgi:hypothetical protein